MKFQLGFVVCLKLFFHLQLCSGDTTNPCDSLFLTDQQKVDNVAKQRCTLDRYEAYFWSRWHDKFPPNFASAANWKPENVPLTIGQVVMVQQEKGRGFEWIPGRIIDIWEGGKGIPRVATVLTASKEIQIGVHKLAPVPLEKWVGMPIATMKPPEKKKKKKTKGGKKH